MDYKEKYENALERARNIRFGNLNSATVNVVCEEIFPELIESEDEKVKRGIIKFLKENKDFPEDWISWLEKQGEQKPTKDQVWNYCSKISHEWWQITMDKWKTLTDEEKAKYNQFIGFNDFSDVLMNITAGALFQLRDTSKLEYEEGSLLLKKPDDTPKPLEVINENQGEQKPADKVEPKFKVGDRVNKNDREDKEHCILTITSVNIDEHCYVCNQCSVIDFGEQDLWHIVEQKPTWSEEDEKYINDILAILGGGRGYRSNRQIEDWLKSLKPQSHWKPTEEQMETLEETIEYDAVDANVVVLRSLINDLKKL